MLGDNKPAPPRAAERIESYCEGFESMEDLNRVRRLWADTGDMDAVMRLAISIKYANMRAKENQAKAKAKAA